jgi:hypothetical protein
MKYVILTILMTIAIARALFIFSSSKEKERISRFLKDLARNIIIAYLIYFIFMLVIIRRHI